VEKEKRPWSLHVANLARAAFWLTLLLIVLIQLFGGRNVDKQRGALLGQFEEARKSRVIAMIHRQESASILGVPVAASISIDDSEAVLRAIRLTPPEQPIDVILHTPGGLVLAAEQIAKALVEHKGKVTVFVPHYAMSGGTLIALAADEIVIDRHAALGPVDPQLGQYPARSLVEVAERPGRHDEQTLILADVGRKALRQVETVARELLERNMETQRAREVARLLASGVWTHDHPLMARDLEGLGLPVRVGVPDEERELMDLYPQPRGREAAVEYVPGPPARGPSRRRPAPTARGQRE